MSSNQIYDQILSKIQQKNKKSDYEQQVLDQLLDQVYNVTDIESFNDFDVRNVLDIQYNLYKQEYLLKFEQVRYDDLDKNQKLELLKERCLYSKQLQIQQYNLQNIFTLYSQMKCLLLYHEPGLGKSIATLSILNNFRQYYQQMQQKIYIIVPGVLLIKNWKDEILKYYRLFLSYGNYTDNQIRNLISKEYSIMTKQTFHQIIQQQLLNIQFQLDNCFIVIDEAHHLADIQISKDLILMLQKAKNIRILLLTATPMKNKADNIIDLINILRVCNNSQNKLLLKSEIFEYKDYVDQIRIKNPQKLMEYTYGYVSCVKNTDKIAFAQPQYHGTIPYGVKFSYLIQCKLGPFQKQLQEDMFLNRYNIDDERNNKDNKDLQNHYNIIQRINKKRAKQGLETKEFSSYCQNLKQKDPQMYNEKYQQLQQDMEEYIEEHIEKYYKDSSKIQSKMQNKIQDRIQDKIYDNLQKKPTIDASYHGNDSELNRGFSEPTKQPTQEDKNYSDDNRQQFDFRFLVSSNFAIPKLIGDKIVPIYSYKELLSLIRFLKVQQNLQRMNARLKDLLKQYKYDTTGVPENSYLQLNQQQDYIQGKIFHKDFVGLFSIKLKYMIDNILQEIPQQFTITVYSNFKIFGTDLIEQTLLANGFLLYKQNMQYDIQDDTRDALTGEIYKDFKQKYPNNQFYPCTFFKISGEETKDIDRGKDNIKESKQLEEEIENSKQILDNVFNNPRNIDGKLIKIFIGSKVIAEGITIANCGSLHILDQSFNFSRMKQVYGRPIRWCQHLNKQLLQNNPDQKVNIRRYAVCDEFFEEYLKQGREKEYKLSVEEIIIRKSEMKYILIKQVERILNQNAIDCILNYNNNNPVETLEKCKKCIPVELDHEFTLEEKKHQCIEECEFMKCGYKCNISDIYSKELHYDESTGLYKTEKTKSSFYINFQNIAYELQQVRQLATQIFIYEQELNFEQLYDKIEELAPQQLKLLLQKRLLSIVMSRLSINKFNLLLNDNIIVYNNKLKNCFILLDENKQIFKLIPVKYFNKYGIYDANLEFYQEQIGQYALQLNDVSKFITEKMDEQKYFQYDKRYYQTKKFYNICGILCDDEYQKKQGEQQSETINCIKQLKIKIFSQKDSSKNSKNEDENDQKNLQYKDINFKHFGYLLQNIPKEQLKYIMKSLGIGLNDDQDQDTQKDKQKDRDQNKNKRKIKFCQLILQRLINLEKYSTDYFYIVLPINQPFYVYPYNMYDRLQLIEQQLMQNRLVYQKKEQPIKPEERIKNLQYKQMEFFVYVDIKEDFNEQQIQLLQKLGFVKETKQYVLIIK